MRRLIYLLFIAIMAITTEEFQYTEIEVDLDELVIDQPETDNTLTTDVNPQ